LWTEAGFTIEEDIVFVPLGPTLLHQLDLLIGRCWGKLPRRHALQGRKTQHSQLACPSPEAGALRLTLRRGRRGLRRLLLLVSYPLDYLLNLRGPSRWAYHRYFILRRQEACTASSEPQVS
jgi:hypothetical protein